MQRRNSTKATTKPAVYEERKGDEMNDFGREIWK
jgi:hypothetical protein